MEASHRGLRPALAGAAAAAEVAVRNAASVGRAAIAVRRTTLRSTPSSAFEDLDRSLSRGDSVTGGGGHPSECTSSRLEHEALPTGPACESIGVTFMRHRPPSTALAMATGSPFNLLQDLSSDKRGSSVSPPSRDAAAWPLPPPPVPTTASIITPEPPHAGITAPNGVADSFKRAFKGLFSKSRNTPTSSSRLPEGAIRPPERFATGAAVIPMQGTARPIAVKAKAMPLIGAPKVGSSEMREGSLAAVLPKLPQITHSVLLASHGVGTVTNVVSCSPTQNPAGLPPPLAVANHFGKALLTSVQATGITATNVDSAGTVVPQITPLQLSGQRVLRGLGCATASRGVTSASDIDHIPSQMRSATERFREGSVISPAVVIGKENNSVARIVMMQMHDTAVILGF